VGGGGYRKHTPVPSSTMGPFMGRWQCARHQAGAAIFNSTVILEVLVLKEACLQLEAVQEQGGYLVVNIRSNGHRGLPLHQRIVCCVQRDRRPGNADPSPRWRKDEQLTREVWMGTPADNAQDLAAAWPSNRFLASTRRPGEGRGIEYALQRWTWTRCTTG